MAAKIKCLACNTMFVPWRGKKYCSERCAARGRKRAERAMMPDAENREEISQQNQEVAEAMSRDESPAFIVREAEWVVCNEVTDKLAFKERAIGWTMNVEDRGWFGRVGQDMSFGPTTRHRARQSVEAFIKGEPFAKHEGEASWRGTAWGILPRFALGR